MLMPAEFLCITIASLFSIIILGLAVYLSLPWTCARPNIKEYFNRRRQQKRKSSCLQENRKDTFAECQNGCCVAYPEGTLFPEGIMDKKPVITGPQGHGFYTSGPWKIDTMGTDANFGVNFTNPELIMSEYFASMMNTPQAALDSLEETVNEDHAPDNCRVMGNLIVCTEVVDGDTDNHSNDFALMDVSSSSDTDMVMMMF